MGTLSTFPLRRLRTEFGLTVVVETGTWLGDGVQAALDAGFQTVHTIEIKTEFALAARRRFRNLSVAIWIGSSVRRLPEVIDTLGDARVLWWLDAHLHDLYKVPLNEANPFPLRDELRIITQRHRGFAQDVFIMDDLRIYEDNLDPVEAWNDRQKYAQQFEIDGVQFIENALGATHNLERVLRDQGYVVATPKGGASLAA